MPHPNGAKWNAEAKRLFQGKRIIEARYMTDEEMTAMAWYRRAVVLVLDDGSIFCPSADDEGNGPGAIQGVDSKGNFTGLPVL